MKCPNCHENKALQPATYEGVAIQQCPDCQGYWLSNDALEAILSHKEETFEESLVNMTMAHAFTGTPEGEVETIKKCPVCEAELIPTNFEEASGIIIDRCPDDHGLWLDYMEIDKIQIYRETWIEGHSGRGSWSDFIAKKEAEEQANKPKEGFFARLMHKISGSGKK